MEGTRSGSVVRDGQHCCCARQSFLNYQAATAKLQEKAMNPPSTTTNTLAKLASSFHYPLKLLSSFPLKTVKLRRTIPKITFYYQNLSTRRVFVFFCLAGPH